MIFILLLLLGMLYVNSKYIESHPIKDGNDLMARYVQIRFARQGYIVHGRHRFFVKHIK